ncbi:MAG TPA: hypothetical protein VEC36_00875, partial [Patescibacteria group bacterium]|nr:hypothetical protein [Patescibacteria group bacterium]
MPKLQFIYKKTAFAVLAALISMSALTFDARAQQRQANDRSTFYDYGEPFFSEAHAGASFSKDSSRIFVYFKILYDALSFTATN